MKKTIIYITSVLAVVLILAITWLYSGFGKAFVRNQIVTAVQKNTAFRVEIDQFRTNYFSSANFSNIFLNSTVGRGQIAIDQLHLQYSILPIIRKNIRIDSLKISGISGEIDQTLIDTLQVGEDPDHKREEPAWKLELRRLLVDATHLQYHNQATDDTLRITGFTGDYHAKRFLNIRLEALSGQIAHRKIDRVTLMAGAVHTPQYWRIDTLNLQSDASRITTSDSTLIRLDDPPKISTSVTGVIGEDLLGIAQAALPLRNSEQLILKPLTLNGTFRYRQERMRYKGRLHMPGLQYGPMTFRDLRAEITGNGNQLNLEQFSLIGLQQEDSLTASGRLDLNRSVAEIAWASGIGEFEPYLEKFGLPQTLSGALSINGTASIPLEMSVNSTAEMSVRLSEPGIGGRSLPDVTLDARLENGRVTAAVIHGENSIRASAGIEFPSQVQMNADVKRLSQYGAFLDTSLTGSFIADLEGQVEEKWRYALAGAVKTDINLESVPETEISAELSITPERAEFSRGRVLLKSNLITKFRGGVTWSDTQILGELVAQEPVRTADFAPEGALNARISHELESGTTIGRISIADYSITPFRVLLPDTTTPMYGELQFSSDFQLDPAGLSGSGSLALRRANFANTPLDSIVGVFSYDTTSLSVPELKVYQNGLLGTVTGQLPSAASDQGVQVFARIDRYPLRSLDLLNPPGRTVGGTLAGDVAITGKYSNPNIQGSLTLSEGFFRWDTTSTPVERINLEMSFTGRSFQLREGSAKYHSYPIQMQASGSFTPALQGVITVQPEGTVEFFYQSDRTDSIALIISELPVHIASGIFPDKRIPRGSLDASFSGTIHQDSIDVTSHGVLQLPDFNERAWDITWALSGNPDEVSVDSVAIRSEGSNLVVSGRIAGLQSASQSDTASPSFHDMNLNTTEFELNVLNPFFAGIQIQDGRLNASLSLDGRILSPQVGGSVSIRDLVFSDQDQLWHVQTRMLKTRHTEGRHKVQLSGGQINGVPFAGEGYFSIPSPDRYTGEIQVTVDTASTVTVTLDHWTPDTVRADLVADNLTIATFMDIINRDYAIGGSVYLTGRLGGSVDNPLITLNGGISGYRMDEYRFPTAQFAGGYQAGKFTIDTLRISSDTSTVSIAGTLPGTLNLAPFSVPDFGREGELRVVIWEYPLEAFEAFLPQGRKLTGVLNSEVQYKLRPNSPEISGYFRLNRLAADLPYFDQQIQNGDLEIQFQNREIRLTEGTFHINNNPVNLAGVIKLGERAGNTTDITVSAGTLQLSRSGALTLSLGASRLRLHDRPDEPGMIEGTISVKSFSYVKRVQNYQLITMVGARSRAAEVTERMLRDIRLNVDIQIPGNARINNNLATIPFSADLQLRGPVHQPRYGGRITAGQGEIYYLGRTFTLQEGQVYLKDHPDINPDIRLMAETVIPSSANVDNIDYTVTMQVEGTLRSPKVNFTVQPPTRPGSSEALTQSDIIGLLAVGRPRSQLTGLLDEGNLQQFLLRQASLFSSQQISSMLEYRASRLLDLDRVAIEGNLFQLSGSNAPTFTAEKSLTSRLTLTYSTVIGDANEQGVRLLYELTPHWYLSTETNQQREYGIDLKYRVKFK